MDAPDLDHGVAALLREAAPLIDAFSAAGHRIYLVGGIVRDLMSRRPLGDDVDLDFTTDATPPQVRDVVAPLVDALWTQGERFGTIGAKVGERIYEITTHRAEIYRDESRKPEVRFSAEIDQDLARRDFTVNAMAIEAVSRSLVDPHGGADDLRRSVLRTPLDPEISFGDDPLRMLRAARFVAGYDLRPEPGLVTAMRSMAARLEIVSVERVRDEFDKLLAVPGAAVGFELLATTGLLVEVMPWLGPDRSAAAVAAVDRVGADPAARLAVLVGDRDPVLVRRRLHDLRMSTARSAEVVAISAGAWALLDGAVDGPPGFRRWYRAFGPHADRARGVAVALDPAAGEAAARCRSLEAELAGELGDLGPPLGAREVMRELDLEPGPEVGRALAHLTEVRLDRGPLDAATAKAELHAWAARRR